MGKKAAVVGMLAVASFSQCIGVGENSDFLTDSWGLENFAGGDNG